MFSKEWLPTLDRSVHVRQYEPTIFIVIAHTVGTGWTQGGMFFETHAPILRAMTFFASLCSGYVPMHGIEKNSQ